MILSTRTVKLWLKAWLEHRHLISQVQGMFPLVRRTDILIGIAVMDEIQRRIIGRHCGGVGDKLAQYCSIVQYVRANEVLAVDSIEIGTLFGGSCLAKLIAMRDLGLQGKIVCIDPMTGYYDQQVDPVTGRKVSPEVLYRNVEILSFPRESVELRQVLSTCVEAYDGLDESRFATLMIDGDHSYIGVLHDWECYQRFVAVGGFVLFDDYSHPSWPHVTSAVRKVLGSLSSQWKACGQLDTTFILQRVD